MNVCFTGHRPNKLGGYDWNTEKNKAIIDKLDHIINKLIFEYGATHFICGGALGVDQMAFEACNKMSGNCSITTEVAAPFKNQACKWNKYDTDRYNNHLKCADVVTYTDMLDGYKIKGYQDGIYYPAKMQKRNMYMVDKSDIVVAVWDGTKGGTGNCVEYAKKQGKIIIRLNPDNMKITIESR